MPRTFKDRMKAKMHKAGMTGLVALSPTHASNRLSLLASSSELGARIKAVIVASFKMQEYLDNLRQSGKRVNVEQIRVLEGVPQFLALQKAVRNLTTYTMSEEIRAKVKLATREFYNKGTYDSFDDYMTTVQEMAGAPAATEASMNIEARIKAHMATAALAPKHNRVIANYCGVLISVGQRWKNDPNLRSMGDAGSEGHILNNFYSIGVDSLMRGLKGILVGAPQDMLDLFEQMNSNYRTAANFNWINTAKALKAKTGVPHSSTASVEEATASLKKNRGTKDWPEYHGGRHDSWHWSIQADPARQTYYLRVGFPALSTEGLLSTSVAVLKKDAPKRALKLAANTKNAGIALMNFHNSVVTPMVKKYRADQRKLGDGLQTREQASLRNAFRKEFGKKAAKVTARLAKLGFKDSLNSYMRDVMYVNGLSGR